MKRKWLWGLTLVSMLAFFTATAYPWGSAVHVYVAFRLKGLNPNIMYGAIVSDCFNYYFGPPPGAKTLLTDKFHYYPDWLWDDASSGTQEQKALAYGFLSHGHLGGADTTAHLAGAHFGKKNGYVTEKAKILDNILKEFPEYAMLKAQYPAVSLEVAHNLVENAIDILMKRADPEIGTKIQAAAFGHYEPYLGWLAGWLGWIYAPGDLWPLIVAVEDAFRGLMLGYGWLFEALPEEALIYQLSVQMADMADDFLPVPMPYETAFAIAKYGTEKAMEICEGTFLKEIEATIKYVGLSLDWTGY